MKSFEHFRINVPILRAQIADLALEEIGSYMRLILHQWEFEGIPNDPERMRLICGWKVSDSVIQKFDVGADGLLRASWVEQQRKRVDKLAAARGRAGRWPRRNIEQAINTCSTNDEQVFKLSLCACGCGKPVKPGRKYLDRTHANRHHGQTEFKDKPKVNVIQTTSGHGSAVDQTRFHSAL